jgi:hypothetical protein
MKKLILIFLMLFSVTPCRADLFGGDVAVLTQILANAFQQLAQLRSILGTGQDNLNLMRDVYKGISDALNLIRTVNPTWDPGVYRDWQGVDDALRKLQDVYGIVIPSSEAQVQKNTDQSVAEAVSLNNSIYTYTKQIDDIGEQIKDYSRSVSPVGAQKLTAQSLGVMLHVLNQSLRAQATGMKLQAEALAIQNRKDKEFTRYSIETADSMKAEMNTKKPFFQFPQF